MTYGYVSTMRAQPGCRRDVAAILVGGAEELREAGCSTYVVSLSDSDDDGICVFEIWQSKAQHDASLKLPEAKAAIAAAMPMLTGEFSAQELTVVGGLGA